MDLDLGGSSCGTAYVACHVDLDLGGMPGGTLLLVLLLVYNKISQINKKWCKFLLSIVQVNMTKLTRQVNTPLYNFC